MSENQKLSKVLLNDAIIISIVTAELYAVAFAYEAGYLGYFQIPAHLVRPSITNIILATVGCALSILSAVKFCNILMPFLSALTTEKYENWRQVIAFNFCLCVIIIFLVSIYPWSWNLIFWLLIVLCGVNFVFIGIPLLINYLPGERLSAHVAIDKYSNSPDLDIQAWINERGGKGYSMLFFCLLGLVGVGWVVGNAAAMNEKYFDILKLGQELILVRSYESHLLCKPFDRKSHSFDSKFVIVPFTDKEIYFEKQLIGPLSWNIKLTDPITDLNDQTKSSSNSTLEPVSSVSSHIATTSDSSVSSEPQTEENHSSFVFSP